MFTVVLPMVLLACTAPAPTALDTPETGVASTGDTAGTPVERPVEWKGWFLGRLGEGLIFVDLDVPYLAMGLPGCCGPEDQTLDAVHLVEPLVQHPAADSFGVSRFRADPDDERVVTGDEIAVGSAILAPGDVTGDGEPDLVVFDTADTLGHGAWLFHGPLLDPALRDTADSLSPISGVPWRGTPCGDLDADGVADLCTAAGVALGPLTGPIDTWDTSWSATQPTADIQVASAGSVADGVPGLLISDPVAATVHRLTTFGSGDIDLAAEASATWTAPSSPTVLAVGGDLDGDGAGDLVVAWEGMVAVSTTLGGDLSAAHAAWQGDARSLVVADLDGDGSDDLVIGGVSEVLLFRGPLAAGSLTRTDAENVLTGHVLPQTGDEYPRSEFGHALAAFDVDGDGDAELAVADPAALYHPDETHIGGRVYLFDDPLAFRWDALDPPVSPIWPDWMVE